MAMLQNIYHNMKWYGMNLKFICLIKKEIYFELAWLNGRIHFAIKKSLKNGVTGF